MLAGRMVALLLSLVTQMVIVRALTKDDYGSFALVLTLLLLGSSIARVGMDKALSRFIPIYVEKGELRHAAGAIVLAFLSILVIGGLLVGVVLVVTPFVTGDGRVTSLLMFMAILAPVEAAETSLQKLLAIFARPRDLMFRRHILGPLLKLVAAIPLLFSGGNVMLLGVCYLIARFLGTAVSFLLTHRELVRANVWSELRRPEIPTKELLAFSVPLLVPDVTTALRTSLMTFFLAYFHGPATLALFRAVLPIARLNLVVSDSFRLLYTPALARLFARQDRKQINELYWSNAAWIALLTYPVILGTFCFAEPLTVLLFGNRYRDASSVLAALAAAEYLNASFGFNAVTLQVLGQVRAVVVNSCIATIAAVLLNFLLIPKYGALGGGLAVVGARLIANGLNQWSLYREGTVRGISPNCARVFAYVILSAVAFFVLLALAPPIPVAVAFAAVIAFFVVRTSSRILEIENVFPEIGRIPALRLLTGVREEVK